MDAATLYTIVTMLDGRERILQPRVFETVAECKVALEHMQGRRVRNLPTRYSCERHLRFNPAAQETD
jgi:hypothetical protein